jgi:hypothetical protein
MFSTPEKQQLPLERCMRILPHHQVRCCCGRQRYSRTSDVLQRLAQLIEACKHTLHAHTATTPGAALRPGDSSIVGKPPEHSGTSGGSATAQHNQGLTSTHCMPLFCGV